MELEGYWAEEMSREKRALDQVEEASRGHIRQALQAMTRSLHFILRTKGSPCENKQIVKTILKKFLNMTELGREVFTQHITQKTLLQFLYRCIFLSLKFSSLEWLKS